MSDRFWVRKNYLYFVLSIMIVFSHSTGYGFYDRANIELHTITKVIIDYFVRGISGIAVPIFMLFSVLLLYRDITYQNMWKKMKSRIISLGIPYLVWNIISVIWAVCIVKLPFLRENVTGERELFTMDNLWKGIFLYKYNGVMWYVAQLILFLALCPIIYSVVKRMWAGILLVLVSGMIYVTGNELTICLLRQDALFYYIFGAFLGVQFWDKIHSISFKRSHYIISIVGIICVFIYSGGKYRGVNILWTLLACFFIWVLINWLAKKKKWWIDISFFIYALHNFLQPCINKLFWIFAPHNDLWALLNLFGGVFFTVGLCVLSAKILMNLPHMKILWNILNGTIDLNVLQKKEKMQCKL